MNKRIQVSIDNIICLADPIHHIGEVRPGDTIIHIWTDPENFNNVSLLTVGKAERMKNGIWFSSKKVTAMQDEEGYYITEIDTKQKNDTLGFAIATESHITLSRHFLYKAVTL